MSLSVIMSAFNSALTINAAVESILNQTYTDFEFIIIDDASSDDTYEILKKIKDSRIKLLRNKSNIGLAASLNKAIACSSGEYVARMDADDISVHSRFERQIEILTQNDNIDICGSWFTIFSEGSEVDNYIVKHPQYHDEIRLYATLHNPIGHPTVMFRRSCWVKKKYDEHFESAQDYKLWLDFMKNGFRFYNIQESLLYYREHEKSITVVKREEQKKYANNIQKEFYEINFPFWYQVPVMSDLFLKSLSGIKLSTFDRYLLNIKINLMIISIKNIQNSTLVKFRKYYIENFLKRV
jgi:glycosyltransferase involved in cell wall biosynthesis